MKRKQKKAKRAPKRKGRRRRMRRLVGVFHITGKGDVRIYSDGYAIPTIGEPYKIPAAKLKLFRVLAKSRKG